MNKEQKNQIVKELNELQERKEWSQHRLSKHLGISSAQVINIREESKWSNVSDDLWIKIRNQISPKLGKDWQLFATYNHGLITALCEDSKENSRMLGISANSGYGKSTSLLQFETDNFNCYYILCDSISRQNDFLRKILKQLGMNESATASQMVDMIVDKLNSTDKPLLILDDYGKVPDSIIRITQLIYDRTEGNCGIIISGVTFLKKNIDNMAAKDRMGFREFKRRVEYWLGLVAPSPKIVTQICNHHGIADPHVVKHIYKMATDYGTLKALITNAKRSAKNGSVNMDAVERMKVGDHELQTQD